MVVSQTDQNKITIFTWHKVSLVLLERLSLLNIGSCHCGVSVLYEAVHPSVFPALRACKSPVLSWSVPIQLVGM